MHTMEEKRTDKLVVTENNNNCPEWTMQRSHKWYHDFLTTISGTKHDTNGWMYAKKAHTACSCHDTTPIKYRTENRVSFTDSPRTVSRPLQARSPSPKHQTQTEVTEIVITNNPPLGIWPLKRTQSVDSRDNPFLPDGDLSKSAEDLLKRATIIRDKFYLQNGQEQAQNGVNSPERQQNLNTYEHRAVDESLTAEVASRAECSPLQDKRRENGKLEDSASPDAVKIEVPTDQTDGVTSGAPKDKKKQKKCCSVM